MICAVCESDTRVLDTRTPQPGTVRRRRECVACGQRFSTLERALPLQLSVVKRSGISEPYDREKLVASLRNALGKRPLSDEALLAAVEGIEERVANESRSGTVPSSAIGDAALDALAALDRMAWLRYASVYLRFATLDDFGAALIRADDTHR